MNQDQWIAVLSVAVALLVGLLPIMQARANRLRTEHTAALAARDSKIEKLETENRTLRDTNTDLKIALGQYSPVADALNRALTAMAPRTGQTP